MIKLQHIFTVAVDVYLTLKSHVSYLHLNVCTVTLKSKFTHLHLKSTHFLCMNSLEKFREILDKYKL